MLISVVTDAGFLSHIKNYLFWWGHTKGGESRDGSSCTLPFLLPTAKKLRSRRRFSAVNTFNNHKARQQCLSVAVDEVVVASPQAQTVEVRNNIYFGAQSPIVENLFANLLLGG